MPDHSLVQRNPALWAALPFAGGILLADARRDDFLIWVDRVGEPLSAGMAGAVLVVACIVLWVIGRRRVSYFAVPVFSVGLAVLLFVAGMCADVAAWHQALRPWPADTLYYKGVLTAVPQQRERTVGCEVTLSACMQRGRMRELRRTVQLTLPRTPQTDTLRIGDGVAFMARVDRPGNTGNPDAFDYADYLYRKGVTGSVFVPAGRWKTYPLSPVEQTAYSRLLRVRMAALQLRSYLLQSYRSVGWNDDTYAVLAALTLGEKSALSVRTKRLYADAGASHLLALSGLHLSLLLIVFDRLFLRRARHSLWRWPAGIVLIGMIWGYVFLTGLSTSLIRAALMTSLFVVGDLMRRRHFTVNSLALAALAMLIANPFYLFDIGFQLSFVSLFFILTLQPSLRKLLPVRRQPFRWAWDLLTVSVAAQIGTAPIVAYTFHSLSAYAAVFSLVLIPFTLLLMYGTIGVQVGWWCGVPGIPLGAAVLEKCVALQSQMLAGFASLPGAVCDGLTPSRAQVALCYLLLLSVAGGTTVTSGRRFQQLRTVCALCAVVGLLGIRRNTLRPMAVFYNNRRCPAVHLIYSPAVSYLLCARPDSVSEYMRPISETFWKNRLTAPPERIGTAFRDGRVRSVNGVLQAPGISVWLVCDNRWNGLRAEVPFEVDYLYVCRGYRGDLRRLAGLVRPKHVVLDASLTDFYLQRFRRSCGELGWNVYVMREEGALKVPLKWRQADK